MGSCLPPAPTDPSWALWAAVFALAGVRLTILPIIDLLRRCGWTVSNWRGEPLPTSTGIVVVVVIPVAYGLASMINSLWSTALAGLLVMLAAAIFGLFDDRAGDRERGWRWHWGGLLSGRWTAGSLKIVGISAGALGAVATVCGTVTIDHLPWVALAAGVVAGSANTVNLLDTGPGRALKFCLFISLVVAWYGNTAAATWLLPVAALSLAMLPVDLAEQAMLGDCGANAIGAALGFGLVLAWPEVHIVSIIFLLLVGVQILGDRYSIVIIIRSSRVLLWLDGFGCNNNISPAGAAGRNEFNENIKKISAPRR